jgi:hypothetical protein
MSQRKSFTHTLLAGAVFFALAVFVAGCSGSSSTPTVAPSSSGTSAPGTSPSASATANASAGSGPFALPANGGYSGTLNETVVSPGASHASVAVQITDYLGSPALPSGITLSTSGLNVFFSFAQTFGPGSGDSVSLGNPFATTLTVPSSIASLTGVAFFSQICYYNPNAAGGSQFTCDANSVQSQSISGTTLVDQNPGAAFPTTSGSRGLPTSSIPYGTTIYKIFFTVASSNPSPTPVPTTGALSVQATTIPFAVGGGPFTAPPVAGFAATLNESVTAITALDKPTSSSMLVTTANGIPSPLPSGVTIGPSNANVFYTVVQQVAPGALPGSTLSGTVTFANPLSVALTVPSGFPLGGTPVFTQLCYYYGGANPSFTCDAAAQAATSVNAATNTIVDTNPGTTNQYWMLSTAGSTTSAAQTYYLAVYKIFYYPTGTTTKAVRGPAITVRHSS